MTDWLKINIAALVALIVLLLGFAYLFVDIWFKAGQAAAVVALMVSVTSYFYGSSPGSKAKDETISKIVDKNLPPCPSVQDYGTPEDLK